jgi:hypothetical protein
VGRVNGARQPRLVVELRLEDDCPRLFLVVGSAEDERRLRIWLRSGRPLDELARALARLLDDDALDMDAA